MEFETLAVTLRVFEQRRSVGASETVSALSELLNSQPVSARQAADRAQEKGIRLPYGTIAAYWAGGHGRPSAATLDKLAQVLPTVTIDQLKEAAWNATAAELGDYQPPSDARFLDKRQRRAIDELIRSIVATRGATGATDQPATDPPATTEDTEDPASEDEKTDAEALRREVIAALSAYAAYNEQLSGLTHIIVLDLIRRRALDDTDEERLLENAAASADATKEWTHHAVAIAPEIAVFLEGAARRMTAEYEAFSTDADSLVSVPRQFQPLDADEADHYQSIIDTHAETIKLLGATGDRSSDAIRRLGEQYDFIPGFKAQQSKNAEDARLFRVIRDQLVSDTESHVRRDAQVHHLADRRRKEEPLPEDRQWAARDLGDEPVGRKIRRRQDEAGELPDAEGPEGGA